MRIVFTMRKSALRVILLFIAVFIQPYTCSAATFTVINTLDSGAGSLRQAILDANANAGNDMIIFNLGAGGPFTINLLTALPSLTDNTGVTIDGWNNSGNNGTPNTVPVFSTSASTPLNPTYKIILGNGANVPTGFVISSTNNLIRGFVMQNFGDGTPDWNDIAITISAKSNTILGCYIGMDQTGTTKGTRTCYGMWITGGNNIIGDGTVAGVNLISGTMGSGTKIMLTSTSATANIIRGNIIGLQSDGTSLVSGAGSAYGIYMQNSAGSNTIGGIQSGEGNLISGNYQHGALIYTSNNVIQGNYIGCAGSGLSAITSNPQSNGISMYSGNSNIVGGSSSAARNLISGNSNVGIDCWAASNQIKGNFIGVNKIGNASFGGQGSGISISNGGNNFIGGLTVGEGNLISGHAGFGILLASYTAAIGTSVLQNTIGPQLNGINTLTAGTQSAPLTILSSNNNIIGGVAGVNSRNIISANSSGMTISNSNGTIVKGNYFGIAADGINRIVGSSQLRGISLQSGSANTIIGGTTAAEANVLSGNSNSGIQTNGVLAAGNVVTGNIIGPQADGVSLVAGNTQFYGILLNGSNLTIGGSASGSRNIISGNNGNGLTSYGINISNLNATGNIIRGNYIGPGANGQSITGATQVNGIYVQLSANSNTIGGYLGNAGTNPQGNVIAFNTQNGISITNSSSNLISRNRIYSNGTGASQFPINLNYGASQGNSGKAAPVISNVIATAVSGNSAGSGDTIEVFTNTTGSCGDMMVYLGSTVADAAGNWILTGVTVNNVESVVATTRSVANNNTSQASTCTAPLPIELIFFKATCDATKINLNWATASEHNSKSFVIEKSTDGFNYIPIASINATGESSQRIDYNFTDQQVQKELVYYRLVQLDANGLVNYYPAVFVNDCDKELLKISAFPTLVKDILMISLSGLSSSHAEIDMIDMTGRIVFQKNESVSNGIIKLSLSTFSEGVYTLSVNCLNQRQCFKVVKE
ncbi:MAG: hypothetical protein K0S32_1535 [Bacteroidetes bacterium]|nr:hypothetical protein [Bacteroidota bacterium]